MRNEHLTWEAGGGGRGGDSFGKTKSVNEARPLAVTQALQKGGAAGTRLFRYQPFLQIQIRDQVTRQELVLALGLGGGGDM